jgi:hypothetical protein
VNRTNRQTTSVERLTQVLDGDRTEFHLQCDAWRPAARSNPIDGQTYLKVRRTRLDPSTGKSVPITRATR